MAERLSYAVGRELISREADAYSALTPQAYADALLDHEMRHDHLGYKDQASVTARELLARDASIGIWQIVREGSLGRSPEDERIEELRARRRELLAGAGLHATSDRALLERLVECQRLTAEIDDLCAARRRSSVGSRWGGWLGETAQEP